jgi:hypothetical protein
MFGLSTLASSLIGAALLAAASFGGGFYAGHHWESVALADQRAQDAEKAAGDAAAALKRLEGFVSSMNLASAQYDQTIQQIANGFQTVQKDFANATKAKPLPVNCKPDAGRVRALTASIAAVNSAANP